MHLTLVVLGALLLTVLAAGGVAGVAGRVPPWRARRVARPRLWGYGMVLSAAGGAVFLFAGPLDGPHGSFGAAPVVGWVAFMAGLALQMLGERPGRTTRTAPPGQEPSAGDGP
ncbi:hypothetical protein ABZT03_32040 [Streptomyces sp. NPDC005574]|uniref:hypothetical protein n=1 Tax=Streptomyces sp. NPDC005574 TaxID=3156891 RepID=UPI0033A974D8